jgi:hypothetical protein
VVCALNAGAITDIDKMNNAVIFFIKNGFEQPACAYAGFPAF